MVQQDMKDTVGASLLAITLGQTAMMSRTNAIASELTPTEAVKTGHRDDQFLIRASTCFT